MGHPLGGVPRAKGLLWHSLGIIVAIGGFVLAQGRGTWASDGEWMGVTRGQWQGLAVSPPLHPHYQGCPGGTGAAQAEPQLSWAQSAKGTLCSLPSPALRGIPTGILSPCPYLGLRWGHSPPPPLQCNRAASSLSPPLGSLVGRTQWDRGQQHAME